jgi:hypothetical protein
MTVADVTRCVQDKGITRCRVQFELLMASKINSFHVKLGQMNDR